VSDAEENNKALIRRFFAAQTKGDLAAVEEMMTLDFVDHRGFGQERSREGYIRDLTEDRAACSSIRYIIEDQAADGDGVISRFTIRGIHDRGSGGVSRPPEWSLRRPTSAFTA
jgi:ketosteroid isomerase-like protein